MFFELVGNLYREKKIKVQKKSFLNFSKTNCLEIAERCIKNGQFIDEHTTQDIAAIGGANVGIIEIIRAHNESVITPTYQDAYTASPLHRTASAVCSHIDVMNQFLQRSAALRTSSNEGCRKPKPTRCREKDGNGGNMYNTYIDISNSNNFIYAPVSTNEKKPSFFKTFLKNFKDKKEE